MKAYKVSPNTYSPPGAQTYLSRQNEVVVGEVAWVQAQVSVDVAVSNEVEQEEVVDGDSEVEAVGEAFRLRELHPHLEVGSVGEGGVEEAHSPTKVYMRFSRVSFYTVPSFFFRLCFLKQIRERLCID